MITAYYGGILELMLKDGLAFRGNGSKSRPIVLGDYGDQLRFARISYALSRKPCGVVEVSLPGEPRNASRTEVGRVPLDLFTAVYTLEENFGEAHRLLGDRAPRVRVLPLREGVKNLLLL